MTDLVSNTRRHDVSFFQNGRIDITARVAKMLELQAGDVVNVSTDGYEYLLYIKHRASNTRGGSYEGTCYPTSRRNTRNFRAHSVNLCRAVIKAVCPSYKEVRLPVGNAYYSKLLGCTVVPIITRNPLNLPT